MMNIGGPAIQKVAQMVGTTGGFANGIAQNVVGQIAGLMKNGGLTTKHAAATIARMLGGNASAIRAAADAATRLQYVHILQQALEKAQRPGGNTQTQINDLTVRLRNLGRESQEASSMTQQQVQQELNNLMQKQQQMFQALSSMLQKQQDAAKGAIQSIGR